MRAARIEAQFKSIKAALDYLMPDKTVRFDDNEGGFNYDFSQVVTPPLAEETEAWGPVEMTPLNKRAEVLRKAEELINGDRAHMYGPIELSFQRHADIWNAMGYRRMVPFETEEGEIAYRAEELDAIDSAMILESLKLSRSVGNHGSNPDDWVDKAGYAGIGAELAEREYGNGS